MWKKVACLFLIFSFIITIVGCGGAPTAPSISSESELVLVRVTDPESNLIFLAGKENEDVVAILGEKDIEGNPTSITGAVYVLEQGVSFGIDAGIDGLPTYLIDSEGNKVLFENYTNSTVDISIYDSSGSLIQDTTTINVDPADLLELKQFYNSFYSKKRWSTENTLFALKLGAVSLSWVGCISSVDLTVFSGGVLTPVAAFACGRAILSTIAAFTPTDIDNSISMAIGAGSCLISGGGCESIALSIMAWAIEEGGVSHAPVITSTAVISAAKDELYSYDVNATDADGDTLVYSLTIKPIGMTINSSNGLINWTPTTSGNYNVTVKVSDGGLFDTQSFTITVEENATSLGSWCVYLYDYPFYECEDHPSIDCGEPVGSCCGVECPSACNWSIGWISAGTYYAEVTLWDNIGNIITVFNSEIVLTNYGDTIGFVFDFCQ